VDDDRWDEQVGSVAEEAQRLLESLRRAGGPADDPRGDRPGREDSGAGPGHRHRAGSEETPAQAASGDPRDSGDRSDEEDDAVDGDAEGTEDATWVCTDPFCRSCPLCRTVAVVRDLSPDTLRRLADLATVAAGVLSDLAGERDRGPAPDGSAHRGSPQPESRTPESSPPGRSRPTRAPGASPIPVRDADEGSGGA
jgi:hypothetical protein